MVLEVNRSFFIARQLKTNFADERNSGDSGQDYPWGRTSPRPGNHTARSHPRASRSAQPRVG
eukprot:4833138-Prymnesium_polylepis.1